jgi:hypothetical protein
VVQSPSGHRCITLKAYIMEFLGKIKRSGKSTRIRKTGENHEKL